MHVTFDTEIAIIKLQEIGYSEEQAQDILRIVQKPQSGLETRRDLEELKLAAKRDLEELKRELKHDLSEQKKDMIIWLGSMIVISTGLLASLIKLT